MQRIADAFVLPKMNVAHRAFKCIQDTHTNTAIHITFIQNQNVHKNLSAAFLSFLWTQYRLRVREREGESSFTHHKCLVNCDCNDARTTWKQLQSTADDREMAINMHLFACAPLYSIRTLLPCSFRFCSSSSSSSSTFLILRIHVVLSAVIFDFLFPSFFAFRVHTVKCWQWRQHTTTTKKSNRATRQYKNAVCYFAVYRWYTQEYRIYANEHIFL